MLHLGNNYEIFCCSTWNSKPIFDKKKHDHEIFLYNFPTQLTKNKTKERDDRKKSSLNLWQYNRLIASVSPSMLIVVGLITLEFKWMQNSTDFIMFCQSQISADYYIVLGHGIVESRWASGGRRVVCFDKRVKINQTFAALNESDR